MARMNPSDFVKKYLSMNVFVVPPGGEPKDVKWGTPVSVKRYHLGTNYDLRWQLWTDVKAAIGTGTTVKVETIDGDQLESRALGLEELWSLYQWPFGGKGSPEQCQVAIQLTYRFRKNASELQDSAGTTGSDETKNFIGLDCNGLVGNYIQRVLGTEVWQTQRNTLNPGPDTNIRGLMGYTVPINSLAEMKSDDQSFYLLAYCSDAGKVYDHGDGPGGPDPSGAGHIMITNHGFRPSAGGKLEMDVSESAGSGIGPKTSTYIVDAITTTPTYRENDAPGAIFNVFRGSAQSNMQVKIGRLNYPPKPK